MNHANLELVKSNLLDRLSEDGNVFEGVFDMSHSATCILGWANAIRLNMSINEIENFIGLDQVLTEQWLGLTDAEFTRLFCGFGKNGERFDLHVLSAADAVATLTNIIDSGEVFWTPTPSYFTRAA